MADWTFPTLDGSMSRIEYLYSLIEMAYTLNELEFYSGRGNYDETHPETGDPTNLKRMYDHAVSDLGYTGSVWDVKSTDDTFRLRNRIPAGPGPSPLLIADFDRYALTEFQIKKDGTKIKFPKIEDIFGDPAATPTPIPQQTDMSFPALKFEFEWRIGRGFQMLRGKEWDDPDKPFSHANSWLGAWSSPSGTQIYFTNGTYPVYDATTCNTNVVTGFYDPAAPTSQLEDREWTIADKSDALCSDWLLREYRPEVEKMIGVIVCVHDVWSGATGYGVTAHPNNVERFRKSAAGSSLLALSTAWAVGVAAAWNSLGESVSAFGSSSSSVGSGIGQTSSGTTSLYRFHGAERWLWLASSEWDGLHPHFQYGVREALKLAMNHGVAGDANFKDQDFNLSGVAIISVLESDPVPMNYQVDADDWPYGAPGDPFLDFDPGDLPASVPFNDINPPPDGQGQLFLRFLNGIGPHDDTGLIREDTSYELRNLSTVLTYIGEEP